MLDVEERNLVRELSAADLRPMTERELSEFLRDGVVRDAAASVVSVAHRIGRDSSGVATGERMMVRLREGDVRGACDIALAYVHDFELRLPDATETLAKTVEKQRGGARVARRARDLVRGGEVDAAYAMLARFQPEDDHPSVLRCSVAAAVVMASGVVTSVGVHMAVGFDGSLPMFAASLVVFATASVAGYLFAGWSMFAAGSIAIVASAVAGPSASQWLWMAGGEPRTVATPAEMATHPNESSFRLKDGRVWAESAGVWAQADHDSPNPRLSASYWVVAPLAASGWNTDKPVPAWAACFGGSGKDVKPRRTCRQRWSEPLGPIAVVLRSPGLYPRAVEKAEAEHQLSSIDNAPIIELVEDATAYATSEYYTALLSPIAGWFAFVVGLLVFRAFSSLLRSRTPPGPASRAS